jgi:hypothetical protein
MEAAHDAGEEALARESYKRLKSNEQNCTNSKTQDICYHDGVPPV